MATNFSSGGSSGKGKYKVGKKRYTLEQMLANPRLRGKLPDSKLPAHLLSMRKENTRRKAPAGPGSSMTVGDIEGMLKTQFGSAEAGLAQRKTEIPQWFAGYKAQLMGMALSQGGQQAAAQQQFAQLGQNSAANAGQANGAANSQTAQANQVSGGGAAAQAAEGQAAARQQGAENVRQSQIAGQAALSRTLHDNQYALLQNQNQQAMQMENISQGDLLKLQQALAGKKSEAYQSILSDERKAKLENFIANNNAADDAADNALAGSKANETKRHNVAMETVAEKRARIAAEKAAAKARDKGKPKTLPQGSQNTFSTKVGEYLDIVKANKGNKYKTPEQKRADRKKTVGVLKTAIPSIKTVKDGKEISVPGRKALSNDLALKIALDLAYDGRISTKYRKLLKSRGYKVNQFG